MPRPPRSRLLVAVGRWGTADVGDPRALQALLAALLLVDVLESSSGPPGPLRLVGAGVVVVATLLSFVVPWSRWGEADAERALGAVAVADVVAIGLVNAVPPGGVSVVLLGAPALLLGRSGLRGVALCAGAVAAGVVLPALVAGGPTVHHLWRGLLPASVAVVAALSKAGAVARSRFERRVVEALVESVDVGLELVDPDGATMHRNERVPTAPFAGDDGADLVPSRTPAARAARGESIDGELVGADGGRRVFAVSARPVSDDGGVVAAAVSWQDVTPLVQAMRSDRDVLAVVSHDVRTPLTAVIGYLELLEGEPLDTAAAHMVQAATRNSHRVLNLLGELVDAASRGTEEESDVEVGVDVVDLVVQCVSALGPVAARAGIQLEVAPAVGPVLCDTDPGRLSRVLDNLLSNAVKYNEAGGHVRVDVRTESGQVVVTVADDGLGIPDDVVERVFERHFRVQEVQGRRPGTGLGLAIVKELVEGLGGVVSVSSKHGVGTTFTVTLPA